MSRFDPPGDQSSRGPFDTLSTSQVQTAGGSLAGKEAMPVSSALVDSASAGSSRRAGSFSEGTIGGWGSVIHPMVTPGPCVRHGHGYPTRKEGLASGRRDGGNFRPFRGPRSRVTLGGAFGLKHRRLETEQTQISEQLGQALFVERGLREGIAELDLPSNSDLALGAGLTETQEANRRFRSTFTQAPNLFGQPLLQFLGGDGCVWMAADCDLAHGSIVGDAWTRGNGCLYPFRIVDLQRRSGGERCAVLLIYPMFVGKT
jgi:hypothetical protein